MFERCTLHDVAAALAYIPADERETWVRMGMAVKSEFGNDGFDTWDDWSQSASNYNAKAARDSWRSFKQGGRITIATLFGAAIDAGWKPEQRELSAERKTELDREREARRVKREAEFAQEAELQARWYEVIAQAAQDVWHLLEVGGKSPYLGKKKIKPFGARFVARGLVIQFADESSPGVDLISGREDITAFFANRTDDTSFRYLKPGCLVVPLCEVDGVIRNLQIIYSGGKKSFLKHGPKSGLSFLIGEIAPATPVVFAEGFATAASVHMATGYPVVTCFDAGNLPVVARAYREALPSVDDYPFVMAGDDDPDSPGNPGRTKALEAANDVGGVAVVPEFEVAANG